MVLLLYLWENVKKWSSFDEGDMREPYSYYGGGLEEGISPHQGTVGVSGPPPVATAASILGKPYTTDEGYQQMGGLRRLDSSGIIRTHFYPEGGWGWIICACAFLAHVTTSGAQLSAGALHIVLANKFEDSSAHHWLGPVSWSVSSVFSPLVVNLCRRKNVRILALIGGILFPLSLVFTSFATELHQIFFSFGLVGGIGSCMVRESSGVVLGEYFRKRRQFVEQVVMAGTGVGVTLFSLLYLSFTRHLEWGLGFRLGAGFCTICILLPAFYRSASQYQPSSRSGGGGGGGGGGLHSSSQNKPSRVESPKSPNSVVVPIGGDICRSLNLFCVPSLKPVLWSAAFSSFGLYAPVFLMSDFGRNEGLSGGSLLLLQTHLGLGLSLGVILGAILTLKKFKCCRLSPRMLCCSTAFLTGLSMIAISSVKGYYGYSLSAWIYGVALGSHLYTLKVLTMELTRTKHWGRIWSCVQSIMSPGILLGSGVTSYAGKPGFYACATFVLIGAGLIGFQLIDLSKCGSPQLSSSVDNDSPIPPAPPPISPHKYGIHASATAAPAAHTLNSLSHSVVPGFYPLRRSISLQQPIYPCCREAGEFGFGLGSSPLPLQATPQPPLPGGAYNPFWPPGYSPYCRECLLGGSPIPPGYYGGPFPPSNMIRSYSLPQTGPVGLASPHPSTHHLKTTGTQTNPNSPEGSPGGSSSSRRRHTPLTQAVYPGSYDRLPTLPGSFLPQDRVIRGDEEGDTIIDDRRPGRGQQPPQTSNLQGPPSSSSAAYKQTVMFASNPQLFPASNTQSSATSTTDTPTTNSQYSHTNHHNHHHHHPHHLHHHHRHSGHHHHHQQTPSSNASQSPRSSPRHYYPQREERRANFIKTHQKSVDSQRGEYSTTEEGASSSKGGQQRGGAPGGGGGGAGPSGATNQVVYSQVQTPPSSSRFYAPGTHTVTIETHKKPGEVKGKVGENGPPIPGGPSSSKPKEPPAFTRHYFDSSKIPKGRGPGGFFPLNTPSTSQQQQQQQQRAPPFGVPGRAQPQQLPFQPNAQQLRQATPPTLPIQTINAKLIQYQRQQQQQQQQQSSTPGDFSWRNIQKQHTASSSKDPFENDPDPPYYPAALTHAQTHAYNAQGKNNPGAKVSSSEFDVEPPKFNSLRRPPSGGGSSGGGGLLMSGGFRSSTHNSSVSSQLNYPQQFGGGGGGREAPGGGGLYNIPVMYQHYFAPQAAAYLSHHYHHSHVNGGGGVHGGLGGGSHGGRAPEPGGGGGRRVGGGGVVVHEREADDCPYCDYRMGAPPLSLSVPALQQLQHHLHYLPHYGGGGGPPLGSLGSLGRRPLLRRRNTWHPHRDQLEAITTSV